MFGRKLGALAGAAALVLGLAACGDDEDDAATTTTTAAAEETTSTTAADEGEGDGEGEEGAPDVNPCAPGESGQLAPPTEPTGRATELPVTAVEYGFEGLDAITATGEYAITLTNGGEELHELVLVKLADEETPLEELLASDEEPEMTEVAFTFACPGATAETTGASMTEPGRYVAVCFIPVGTTPETDPAEFETMGPPHAMQGMVQEIILT